MDISKLRSGSADVVSDKKVKDGGALGRTNKVAPNSVDADLAASRPSAAESSEKVSLSHEAQALREGLEVVKGTPDVRADKVKALRDAIRAGTYKVDDKAVAEKMIKASIEDDILTRME